MTSENGVAAGDEYDEPVEAATVAEDEAAQSDVARSDQDADGAVAELDAEPAEAAGEDEPAAEAAPAEDDDLDPVEKLRKELRSLPGDWYVVHSYAGYENKVKNNLETRTQTLDVEDYIFQIEVPTKEVTQIKNGQRKIVQEKVLPGYILVRMELNDASWSAVRNTPGVTGFVGATSKPSPLTVEEVVKFLAPEVEKPPRRRPGVKPRRTRPLWARPRSRSTSRSASRSRSWTARSRRCPRRSARSTRTRRS